MPSISSVTDTVISGTSLLSAPLTSLPSSGLVGRWRCNEAQGTNTLFDTSTNSNDMIVQGTESKVITPFNEPGIFQSGTSGIPWGG